MKVDLQGGKSDRQETVQFTILFTYKIASDTTE